MASFLYYLAGTGTLLALSLIVPVLVGLSAGEVDVATRLAIHAGLFGFVMSCVMLGTSARASELGRMQGIILMVAAWIFFPLAMAIPIADILNLSYANAVFEAISGFTTTGSTAVASIEQVPATMVLFLAQLQWLGALATIISFTLILAPNGIGGLPTHTAYHIAVTVLSSPRQLLRYAMMMSEIFLLITLICFGALMLTGVKPFEAFILALTAVSTGGLLPKDAPLEETVSISGMMVMALFMLISATSIFWHRMLVTWRSDQLKMHRESWFVIAFALFLAVYIATRLIDASGLAGLQRLNAMYDGLFNAISIVSTSGIESRPGIFSVLSPIVVLTFLVIGGGCFSAAGGTKMFRIGAMSMAAYQEINRLISPNAVNASRFGSIKHDINTLKAIWSYFIISAVVLLAGGLALSVHGFDFQASFTACAAAFSNAGPAYNTLWVPSGTPGWPAYFDMGVVDKLVLCVLMILGRLETIAVLAAFNILYWLDR